MIGLRRALALLILSPWLQVGRGLAALVSCILALEMIDMTVDITNLGTPDSYIPYMLIGCIVMAVLIGKLVSDTLYQNAVDKKTSEGKIASAADLPKDRRYSYGTIVAMILAAGTGMGTAGWIIRDHIIGAGLWTYVFVAAIVAAVAVAVYILILHWGLRIFIVRAGDYVVSLAKDVADTKAKVEEAAAVVKTASASSETKTEAAAVDSSSTRAQ